MYRKIKNLILLNAVFLTGNVLFASTVRSVPVRQAGEPEDAYQKRVMDNLAKVIAAARENLNAAEQGKQQVSKTDRQKVEEKQKPVVSQDLNAADILQQRKDFSQKKALFEKKKRDLGRLEEVLSLEEVLRRLDTDWDTFRHSIPDATSVSSTAVSTPRDFDWGPKGRCGSDLEID